MSLLSRRVRDDVPEPRTPRARSTALLHGALIEISRLDAKATRLEHENARLRAKLACYEAREDRMLDLRGDMHRGELNDEEDSWPDR